MTRGEEKEEEEGGGGGRRRRRRRRQEEVEASPPQGLNLNIRDDLLPFLSKHPSHLPPLSNFSAFLPLFLPHAQKKKPAPLSEKNILHPQMQLHPLRSSREREDESDGTVTDDPQRRRRLRFHPLFLFSACTAS